MGVYRLSASCQLLHFKSLHRRLIPIVPRSINFMSKSDSLTNAQHKTPSTPTSLSTQWELHLSVTPTHGNRTLPVKSREWRALRAKILLRDKRTCSSCGYLSPYPQGLYMIVDHKDGDASNNNPSNLRVHCPPCDAIRHCGFSGLQDWLTVGESTMKQVEIVRKTREMFENTGVFPHFKLIDPSVKSVDISVLELANAMLSTPWKDLPEEFQRLRGFFTNSSSRLFQKTMLTGNLDTKKPNIKKENEALYNNSDAAEIAAEKFYGNDPILYFLPSGTLNNDSDVGCIRIQNPRLTNFEDNSLDLDALSFAWDKICAEGLPELSVVDKLAEQFNVLSGKWVVFVSSDKVDNLWRLIGRSTLAGTMGITAEVSKSPRDEAAYSHEIRVYNADYRSIAEVNRIRDRLRRLGVEERISYEPDIYKHCGIYKGNSWGIPPSRYHS